MKITKPTLKRIIKEEILKEMMGGKELAQIRHLANPPGNKSLLNILKAYYALASIEDAKMRSMAYVYFMKHFGKSAFEIARQYDNYGRSDKPKQDFTGLDLSGFDLSGGIFGYANFSGANLEGASLRGAYLHLADLTGANLKDADLTGAVLNRTVLFKTDFTGADLTNSFMVNPKLNETNFTNANLANVNLHPAVQEGGVLKGSIFKGVKWNSATLINSLWFSSTGPMNPSAERFLQANELVQTDEVEQALYPVLTLGKALSN